MISAIVAVDNNFGIGNKNNLLVHIPEDMKMFKKITTNNIVVMGRKTYDSLPNKPLSDRINFVVTTNPSKFIGQHNPYNLFYFNMEAIKNWLSQNKVKQDNDIYIIGGGQIYNELLPFCERVYLTKIFHSYENVDTYFPNIDNLYEWEATHSSDIKTYKNIKYQFYIYDKVRKV